VSIQLTLSQRSCNFIPSLLIDRLSAEHLGDAARLAAKLAKIEIAAEKPVVTVEDALAAKTKDVGNPYQFLRRDPAKAIASARHSVSESFRIGGQEHFYLEGQVSLAVPEEHGAVTVHCSTQHPSEVQHLVAHMLHVQASMVTVECRRMGGAFGGKESQASQWAAIAAFCARLTGKPCKLRLDRDDDFDWAADALLKLSFAAGNVGGSDRTKEESDPSQDQGAPATTHAASAISSRSSRSLTSAGASTRR
jgi:CO/xanthine dehydrogenase Mo-binding subunit